MALRKIATEERMGKRRASLKSLESDFEKAKHFIQKVKPGASSSSINDSLDGDNHHHNHQYHRDNKSSGYDSHDSTDGLERDESIHDTNNNNNSRDGGNRLSVVARRRDNLTEGGIMFVVKRERPLSSIY